MSAAPLIVFDWDGTLLDSTAHIVAVALEAIAALGLPARAPEQVRQVIGLGLTEAWQSLYPGLSKADIDQFSATYRQRFPVTELPRPTLFRGCEAMLCGLANRGFRMAVATGKSRGGLDRDIAQTAVGHYFSGTRTAEETRSKPHPQMLEQLMDELGVVPSSTLMVGDTDFDLHMAAHAGVAAVAVTSGAHSQERLLAAGPLHCLQTVAALPAWLDEQRSQAWASPAPG